MIVRVLAEAEHELFATAAWYEDQETGVGVRFLNAYEIALGAIRERADAMTPWEAPPANRDIRRVRLRRFPYLIVYELSAQNAVVLAVAHMSRRPAYWIGRQGE